MLFHRSCWKRLTGTLGPSEVFITVSTVHSAESKVRGWNVSSTVKRHRVQNHKRGTSLVVQWLRPCASNAGGLGSIPGQGTYSHMLQLKIPQAATKTEILHATTKTRCSQINKNKYWNTHTHTGVRHFDPSFPLLWQGFEPLLGMEGGVPMHSGQGSPWWKVCVLRNRLQFPVLLLVIPSAFIPGDLLAGKVPLAFLHLVGAWGWPKSTLRSWCQMFRSAPS